MMPVVNKSIFIKADPEKVYRIAIDPKRWEQWYVELTGPLSMIGTGEVGSKMKFTYSMVGIHLQITIKVLEAATTPAGRVWRGSFSGGIVGTQKFLYMPAGNGTQVDVEIEYTVPGKVLGRIANTKTVERMQENNTANTLENLKALVEHE